MDDFNDPAGRETPRDASAPPIVARPVTGVPSWETDGPVASPMGYSTHVGVDGNAGVATSPHGALFPSIDQSPAPAILDLAAVISVLVAFAVYSEQADLPGRIADLAPSIGPFGWVFANGVVALTCVGLVMLLRGQTLTSMGLRGTPLRLLVPVTLLTLPAAWLTGIVCNIAYVAFQMMRGETMDDLMRDRLGFISVISEIDMTWVAPLSIFVGIYEEILFRGFIMTRLASATRSRWAGVILSSLMFGAVHFTQGWLGIFQTTCLGFVLASAAVLGRSLWPAIIAHAAIDAVSLAMSSLFRSDFKDLLQTLTTTQAG